MKVFVFLFFNCIILNVFNIHLYAQDVVINELMSKNTHFLQDQDGDYSDWIELYNTTDRVINLENFGLSDDKNQLYKWVFPDVEIAPKGFLLVFASGKDIRNGAELHTNFKIAQSGETLILTDLFRNVLSNIRVELIPDDKSQASINDGSEWMNITNTPTPNSSNNNFAGVYSSHQSGFYVDDFMLNLIASNPQHQIYYTLNGETPSPQSYLYTQPISISNNQNVSPSISLIPTTPLFGEEQLSYFVWKTPKSVYRSHAIKYAAFENGELKSEIYSKSFFVDSTIRNRYTFPVISIVVDSLHLFDYEKGIYIPGKTFDIRGFDYWPIGNYHNRGSEWERPIHISFFENDGRLVFETDAGMRMRGYGSTSYPQKSFNVYFRNEYGLKNIEYPIFPNSNAKAYKRLVFRNSGNDFIHTHFKDAMLQELIQSMNLELQAFQPSIVFINGEYWGIHNIREKYDKHYFKYKYDINEDEVNILNYCGEVEEGDNSDYKELESFVEDNDLSILENYNFVAEKIDIDNFIDFQIAEIYFANYDWPCNNYKIWKDNQPDSKWRFLIYDLDLSFGYDGSSSFSTNSLEHATSTQTGWPHCPCSNLLFRNLLNSDTFRMQFLDRFSYTMKNVFEIQRVNNLINKYESMYFPEMEEHIDRWHYPYSIEEWKSKIENMRVFARYRPQYMSEDIIQFVDVWTHVPENRTDNPQRNNRLVLYPNPNQGNFSIQNVSDKHVENGKIIIIDAQGRVIYSKENVFLNAKENLQLSINNSVNGVYFLILISNQVSEMKRLVISK